MMVLKCDNNEGSSRTGRGSVMDEERVKSKKTVSNVSGQEISAMIHFRGGLTSYFLQDRVRVMIMYYSVL